MSSTISARAAAILLISSMLVACAPQAPVAPPSIEPLPTTRVIGQQPGGPAAAPTPAPTAPIAQPSRLTFGVVGHLYYTDRERALTLAHNAGFQWIRQQIHWRDIEDSSGQYFWGELDAIVDAVNAAGLKLLINVTRSPAWYTSDGSDGKPDDPQALARFMGAMADRYRGRLHAIEVWNEQNLAHENGGLASLDEAGTYVEILMASYTAIKAVDPAIIVVAGAPSTTATSIPTVAVPDIDYLRAMYTYRDGIIRDFFDVQGLHPGGAANPPDTLWPDNPSTASGWTTDSTFYFRHIENQRALMEIYGLSDKPVWITEYGWATRNTTPGFEFGNQISLEQQRDYIVGAIEYTYRLYPWVTNMFLWNLNFAVIQREAGVDPLHEQGSFGILNADWSPRPSYMALQETIWRIRREQGNA